MGFPSLWLCRSVYILVGLFQVQGRFPGLTAMIDPSLVVSSVTLGMLKRFVSALSSKLKVRLFTMNRRFQQRRRWVQPLFRVSASVTVLVLVIHWIEPENLIRAFQDADPPYLLSGGLSLLVAQVLSSYKWLLIVRGEGGEVRFLSALRIYFLGMFVNNFLPTGLGGDTSRVILVARKSNLSVGRSAWTVLFDRGTGFLALTYLGLLAASWYLYGVLGLAIFLPAGLVGCALLLTIRHRANYFPVNSLWVRSWNFLVIPVKSPSLWPAVILSFAFNFILITAIFLVAKGFGIDVPWSFVPILTLIVSASLLLPIFVGGYGAREAAFVLALGYVGVDPALAGALGLTWGLIIAVIGLGGGLLLLLNDRTSSGNAADAR